MTDKEINLIKKSQKGDQKAFGELIEKYYPFVFAYIRKRVPTKEVAEDLTALTFQNVVQSIKQFKARGNISIKSWIFKIATNEIRQHFRKASTRREVASDDIGKVKEEVVDTDIAEELSLTQANKILRFAIEKLPQADQEILTLRFFEGFESREIARILGIRSGAVATRLHRALIRLRREITGSEKIDSKDIFSLDKFIEKYVKTQSKKDRLKLLSILPLPLKGLTDVIGSLVQAGSSKDYLLHAPKKLLGDLSSQLALNSLNTTNMFTNLTIASKTAAVVASLAIVGTTATTVTSAVQEGQFFPVSEDRVIEETTETIETTITDSQPREDTVTVATKDYCDDRLNFGFDYPANWGDPKTEDLIAVEFAYDQRIVTFENLNQDEVDRFVIVVNAIGTGLEGKELINREDITVDGRSGIWMNFSDPETNRHEAFVTFGDTIVLVNFTTEYKAAHDVLVQNFLDSWTFSCGDLTADWKTYTDQENGWSMRYPKDWTYAATARTIPPVSITPYDSLEFSSGLLFGCETPGTELPYRMQTNREAGVGRKIVFDEFVIGTWPMKPYRDQYPENGIGETLCSLLYVPENDTFDQNLLVTFDQILETIELI